MAAALKLLIAGPLLLYVVLFGAASTLLEIFTRYARYVSILKWLCLSLLSYVACAFVVKVRWAESARPLSGRRCRLNPLTYLMAIVACTRHLDQPVPVLLAGAGRGRGRASQARREAVD